MRTVNHSIGRLAWCMPVVILCACVTGCADATAASDSIHDVRSLDVIEEKRIGSVDDPDLGFSRIYTADVDRDGNVYVLDAMAYEIRAFAPQGNLLHRIGRRGGGPGEFEDPPRFGIKGDTLWTYDSASGRITLFNRQGEVIETGRTNGAGVAVRTGTGYVTPTSMRDDGLLVGWFTRLAYRRDDDAGLPPDSAPIPRVLFDASGAVVDTLGPLPSAPPRMVPPENHDRGLWQRITVGGQSYTVPDPPTDLPDWLALDDGHVVVDVPYATTAEQGTFSVTRIAAAGDTVYHRVLTYRPQRFTEERMMAAAGRQPTVIINGQVRRTEMDEAVVNAIRARMNFPEFMLPVMSARVIGDESVWLQLTTDTDVAPRWVVLTPQGDVVGEVELPPQSRPLWSDGEIIWAAVPDDLDVPWLVRYRIASASSDM
jgi:hypothetical protein